MRVSAQMGVCPGGRGVVCPEGRGYLPRGGDCPGGLPDTPCRQNDRRLWKHYLATTTLQTVTKKHSSQIDTVRSVVWGRDMMSLSVWSHVPSRGMSCPKGGYGLVLSTSPLWTDLTLVKTLPSPNFVCGRQKVFLPTARKAFVENSETIILS